LAHGEERRAGRSDQRGVDATGVVENDRPFRPLALKLLKPVSGSHGSVNGVSFSMNLRV
jgi:hypothetical protein